MRAVIFCNGTLPYPEAARAALRPADLIIAADGGAHHCAALGLTPHVIIGDLDSLSPEEAACWARRGVEIIRYPPAKDETDLELALRYALQRQAREVALLGLLGGRWDMVFANLLLLGQPAYAALTFAVLEGPLTIHLLRGGETLHLRGLPGDPVSVLPLGGDAVGLSYQGLTWPLENATLPASTPRGVSNTLQAGHATITLREGMVLCFHSRKEPEEPKEVEESR